jgi:hypothetical protein
MNNASLPFASSDSCSTPGAGSGDPCSPVTPKASLGGGGLLPSPSPVCLPSADPVGGSGCVCLDQKILLGDGELLQASEISVGMVLQGVDCERSTAPQTVTQIQRLTQPCLKITLGDHVLRCSVGHLLMTPEFDIVRAGDLSAGDELLDGSLLRVKVDSIEMIGEQPVVTWLCLPNHNYFAEGILHHNKLSFPSWAGNL